MLPYLASLLPFFEFIGRAGGGGSSGGGAGGGGGIEAIALAGYIPSYYLGKFVKKIFSRKIELIISSVCATAVSILLIAFILPAGGLYIVAIIITGIWFGWAAAFFDVWSSLTKRIKNSRKVIQKASEADPTWNEASLLEYARARFLAYQDDWSNFRLDSILSYTTPDYGRHAALLLQALKELGRTNRMSDVTIINAAIIHVMDDTSAANNDTFTVMFEAKAVDKLIDESGTVLYTDKRAFLEAWDFIRDGTSWRLSAINQHTADQRNANRSLIAFAREHAMYYSLDMGWLLIPQRSILLGTGKFGVSDINNHVIGYFNDHLLQMYTYNSNPQSIELTNTLVVQLALPRSYEGIIVQRTQSFFSLANAFSKPPSHYTRYTYEWPEFNKRYAVYATNQDRLSSFELINPGFMAYLYDNDPAISIEVTDNTLFLVKRLPSQNVEVSAESYDKMLTIAMKAFKELRL